MRPGDVYIARRGPVVLREALPAGRWAATEVRTRIQRIFRPDELRRKATLYDLAILEARK